MNRRRLGFFNIEFPSDPPFIKTEYKKGGGAGKSLLDLILNLNQDKYSFSIFSIGNTNRTQYESPRPHLELYRYPTTSNYLIEKSSLYQNILSPKFFVDPLRKRLDLIHCQLGYLGADIAALNYKRKHKVPLLLSLRGIPKFDWKKLYRRILMKIYSKTFFRKILETSDKIIVQSKYIISNFDLLTSYRDKIEIVPNGVDFKTFSKYNNEKIKKLKNNFDFGQFKNILLFVGSLSERKGVPTLIKSFEGLLKQYRNTLLIITGTGKMEWYIKKKAIEGNFQNNILLTGYINDKDELAKIYSTSDLLILPSTEEGFPRVILESMAAGTPCLVSNIGPNIGALDGGRLGLVAEKYNPKDFTNKIIESITMNDSKKNKLIEAIITYSKNHSWSKVARKMELIYDEMLN